MREVPASLCCPALRDAFFSDVHALTQHAAVSPLGYGTAAAGLLGAKG